MWPSQAESARSAVRVADLAQDGTLGNEMVVAGSVGESVEQPMWLTDDHLLFLSDRSGGSSFYRAELSDRDVAAEVVTRDEIDYGRPRWVADLASYDVLPDGRVATTRCRRGFTGLAVLDPSTGEVVDVPTGLPFVAEVNTVDARYALVGTGSPSRRYRSGWSTSPTAPRLRSGTSRSRTRAWSANPNSSSGQRLTGPPPTASSTGRPTPTSPVPTGRCRPSW